MITDFDEKELLEQEARLKSRMEKLAAMEADVNRKAQEVREKEKEFKEKEKAKKQVPLRLAPSLWEELSAWAEEDFRSVNGQIEYLLAECVRKRKKN